MFTEGEIPAAMPTASAISGYFSIKKAIAALKSSAVDYPMVINGKDISTGDTGIMRPPHETSFNLGTFHKGNATHVQQAIDAALKARPIFLRSEWASMRWQRKIRQTLIRYLISMMRSNSHKVN